MPVPTLYRFVNGNGDDAHAAALTDAAKDGWTVIDMLFDPDGLGDNKRVVVLLRKGGGL
jgi:hypothetical protein